MENRCAGWQIWNGLFCAPGSSRLVAGTRWVCGYTLPCLRPRSGPLAACGVLRPPTSPLAPRPPPHAPLGEHRGPVSVPARQAGASVRGSRPRGAASPAVQWRARRTQHHELGGGDRQRPVLHRPQDSTLPAPQRPSSLCDWAVTVQLAPTQPPPADRLTPLGSLLPKPQPPQPPRHLPC